MKERPDYRLYSWENSGYLDETIFLLCSDIVLQTKVWKGLGAYSPRKFSILESQLDSKVISRWVVLQSVLNEEVHHYMCAKGLHQSQQTRKWWREESAGQRVILQRFRDTSPHSSIHMFICFNKLHNTLSWSCGKLIWWELTSWEFDLVGVDLVEVDFMGVDLVGGRKLHYNVQFLRIL